MAKSIKFGSDTYLDWTGVAVTTEEITATTGTSIYHSFYYVDVTPSTTRPKCISITVINEDTNRPAFAQWRSDTSVRIWSPTASSVVTIRVIGKR